MFGYENALFYKIAEEICQMIVSGEINPGDKLPAVRELAKSKKANPNTVQKAYQLLEEQEIVYAIERSGKFVSEDLQKIESLRQEVLNDEIKNFVKICRKYNFKMEEIIKMVKENYERTDN